MGGTCSKEEKRRVGDLYTGHPQAGAHRQVPTAYPAGATSEYARATQRAQEVSMQEAQLGEMFPDIDRAVISDIVAGTSNQSEQVAALSAMQHDRQTQQKRLTDSIRGDGPASSWQPAVQEQQPPPASTFPPPVHPSASDLMMQEGIGEAVAPGAKVEAWFKGIWHPAVALNTEPGGLWKVQWDEDHSVTLVHTHEIRPRGAYSNV